MHQEKYFSLFKSQNDITKGAKKYFKTCFVNQRSK